MLEHALDDIVMQYKSLSRHKGHTFSPYKAFNLSLNLSDYNHYYSTDLNRSFN